MLLKILSSAFATCYEFLRICYIYFRSLFGSMCQSRASLTGKTAIITGGNTGIGKETAVDFTRRGAKVIIACRDTKKGEKAVRDIQELVPDAKICTKRLDLASFASIRKFAADILKNEPYIHILINNAGIGVCPKWKTEDGFEMQFGVNHLGHFLLTTLLLDRIKASAPARIVNVSSMIHRFGQIDFSDLNMDRRYSSIGAYSRSKLANVLFTRELARRLEGTGVTVYCLHPGLVHTELIRHMKLTFSSAVGTFYHYFTKLVYMNPRKGAQTTIHCAVEESLANESGLYYSESYKLQPSRRARDEKLARKLWDVSEKLVQPRKDYTRN